MIKMSKDLYNSKINNKEMERYETFTTETFDKIFAALDKTEQNWIIKTREKLEENPTGKPLTFNWFREKKYLNKRLYYLIDKDTKKILFISFAPKKEQQSLINFVKLNMPELLNYLRNL